MPTPPLRLPITNAITGESFTATLRIGANGAPAQVILDTGSAMLAVARTAYDPDSDGNATTTRLLQVAQYLSGSFVCGVINSSISLGTLALKQANVAVTYSGRPDCFETADGIWGLAYQALDNAFTMPADSWKNQYDASQTGLGQACDLVPLLDQLQDGGLTQLCFALRVQRALACRATASPQTDPLNQGLLVLGGGAECTDLYSGALVNIAVLDGNHYNVNLTGLQVGTQPAFAVQGVAPGSSLASNAVVDSGVRSLTLYQTAYNSVLDSFGAIDPGFKAALTQGAIGGGSSCDQTTLDLSVWPPMRLMFQAPDGSRSVVTIGPEDYWQFDAYAAGQATAMMCGDDGYLGGQSLLGLPLFCGNYVIFDRTAANGHGVVRIARQ